MFLMINLFFFVFAMVQQAYWDLPQRCSFLNNFGGKHLFYWRALIVFFFLILRALFAKVQHIDCEAPFI